MWQNYNPVQIVSGNVEDVSGLISGEGEVLVVTTCGSISRLSGRLNGLLLGSGVTVFDEVVPNPDLDFVDQLVSRFRNKPIDQVVALGGGSVLDVGKCLALLLPSQIKQPLQKIFREGMSFQWKRRLPLVCVPTTSGTGSEVTPFATVWDHRRKKKFSLATSLLFPDIAYLDASLITTLPGDQTLYCGLDAIAHALESLWNKNRTPVTRALAIHALMLLVKALPEVLVQPGLLKGRSDMLNASVLAGLAISQTRTALAHAISYPLTAHLNIPHGLACGFTLPALLRANLKSVAADEVEEALLNRVLLLLEGLGLDLRINTYANHQQIEALLEEMYSPGRSDNYYGVDLGGSRGVIEQSFKIVS